MEKELADIIYVFSGKDDLGIKFYDRTPSVAEAEMTGIVPKGKYITDFSSMSRAKWDDSINNPLEEQTVMTRQGEVRIKTIMVSKQKLIEILDVLLSSKKDGNRVVIDTRENQILNEENYNNVDMNKEDIISSFKK